MASNNIPYPNFVASTVLQKSFSAGVDTISADTALAPDAYQNLINARQRYGFIDPIKKHKLIQEAPVGLKQGIIGVNNLVIIFVAGRAYYKVEDGSTYWRLIPGISMSTVAPTIWACAVPATYSNYVRKASATNVQDIVFAASLKVSGIPSGIVVQDGINQPQFITIDINTLAVTGRTLKKFADWNNAAADGSDREYVPIGRQMMYHPNGILFIVSPDQSQVYRSITGRPIDFMVNVDSNGNKLADEATGGAGTVSFAMDFDPVTLISPVNIPDSFVYGTGRNVRIITMDYNKTEFGEPTFKQSALIEAGVVNQYSWIELVGIGDYAFIDFEGVISFNAVQQLKFNGRNSIFSLAISKVLKDIRQTKPCCINFSNFTLFSLSTIWGSCIAIFDCFQQKWVGFDVTEAANIVQFALTETPTTTSIYAITSDNTVYQLYALTTTYTTTLFTRAVVATETNTEHKSQHLRLLFNSGTVAGNVTVTEYVDGQVSGIKLTKALNAAPEPNSIVPPFFSDTAQNVDNPSFALKDGKTGKKIAYMISWTNDAKLVEFEVTTSWKKSDSSAQESNTKVKNIYG